MKRFKFLPAFLILFTALSFIACETEPVDSQLINNPNPTPENPEEGDAVFKVDFDGQTYTATSTTAVMGQGLITIGGFRGTQGESVALVVDGTQTGTYTEALMVYTPSNASEYGYTNVNPDLNENQDPTGSVIITSIDTVNHTISGTFAFTGWWSDADADLPNKIFTNGVFENIPYTGGPGTNPIPGEDAFIATVDGTFNNYASDLVVAVSGEGNDEILSLTGNHATHDIYFSIRTNTPAGTYNLTPEFMVLPRMRYYDAATDTTYNVEEGQVIITSNNGTRMVGTFSGVVKDAEGVTIHTITAGGFDVDYVN
jgi:hypothetical protein